MSTRQKDVGSSPAHDQKFFVQVFSGFVRLFFANFSNVLKGSPLHFFPILQNGYSKTPKGPPLTFFRTMRLTADKKISKKNFKKNWIFNFSQAGTVEKNT